MCFHSNLTILTDPLCSFRDRKRISVRILAMRRKEELKGKGKGVQSWVFTLWWHFAIGGGVPLLCRFSCFSIVMLPDLKVDKPHRGYHCPSNTIQYLLPLSAGVVSIFEMLCPFPHLMNFHLLKFNSFLRTVLGHSSSSLAQFPPNFMWFLILKTNSTL